MKDVRSMIMPAGILGAFCLLLVGAFILTRSANTFDPEAAHLFPTHAFGGGRSWELDIAATSEARSLGLGERESYPAGRGMLFLFPSANQHGFWMKGMHFPLDIIFLRSGRIVFIERSFQPTDTRIVAPPVPADQVLEVNAGEADHLSPGDRIWYWRSII